VGERLARGLPGAGAGDRLVYLAALASAGAAAIHLAVAKPHFDEYTLFGVFFVGSGLAQLAWPIWLLFRRWQLLLVLGAFGNALIVASGRSTGSGVYRSGRNRGSRSPSASATA
jgi:hypothetical protein